LQLKNEEPKVPIYLSDELIQGISVRPWKKQNYRIEVPPFLLTEYMADVKGEMNVPENPAVMEFVVNPTYGGQGLNVQDYMVLNIMYANQWKKPIYFALTVSDGNKTGLNEYLRMDGMSMKLIPFKGIKISPSILEKNLFEKYKFRKLNDPNVYYDDQTIDLLQNYRYIFTQLALHYYNKGDRERVLKVLDKMEEIMPSSIIPINKEDIDMVMGRIYADCGRPQELEKRLDKYSAKENVNHEKLFEYAVFYKTILNNNTKSINTLKKVINIKRDFVNAYSFLMSIYDQEKLYKEEIELIEQWLIVNPNDAGARKKLEGLRGLLLTKGDSIKVIK
jgi:tetratricopeptide (TPR) repeat protein